MYPVRSSEQLLQHQGEGSAYIYNPADFSALNHFIMANKADAAAKEKQKADRDAKLAEKYDYHPKSIFSPYQKEQDAKYSGPGGYMEKLADVRRQGIVDPTHPAILDLDARRNELEQNHGKGEDMEKSYLAAIAAARQDPYLKKDQAISQVNDLLYNNDGTAITPINEANPRAFQDVLSKPENFNLQAHGGAVAKDTTPGVRSFLHEERLMGGVRTNEDEVKTLFHEYDDNGKLKLNPDGTPVIAITPATKQLFYNKDPRARAAVGYELNKQNEEIAAYNALPENKNNQKPLVTEDDVIKQNLSPYAYHQENHKTGTLNKPEKTDAETSKVVIKPAVITSNTAVMQHVGKGTPKQVGSHPLASPGYSITLKNGKSPIVDVSPDHYWDATNGEHVLENKDAFDMEVTGAGLAMVKPDGKLLSTTTPDETIKIINKKPLKDLVKYQLTKFAIGNVVEKANTTGDSDQATSGTVPKKTANVHNKRIYIPMTAGHLDSEKINSATGGQTTNYMTPDMKRVQEAYDNRINNASDAELIELINDQYPNDTPEQKKQVFLKMRQQ